MTVLWILTGLFGLIALFSVLPLRVFLRYRPDNGFFYRVKYLCFTLADSAAEEPAEAAASTAKPQPKSDRRAVKKLLSFLGLEDLSDAASVKRALREKGTAQTLHDVCATVKRLLSDTVSLVRRGKFRTFELHITVGDGDPADAALSYGTTCAAVYPLVTLLTSAMKLKRPRVDIRCDYAQVDTTVFFDGQVNYRPWHFVCFLCRLFANYLKKEK